MTVSFTIRGRLPGLNEYIDAERKNRYAGAKMKKQAESVVMHAARSLGKWKAENQVCMTYHWYEPDRRRDKDNISGFGRKVIQDALVHCGILHNDGWREIKGFEDHFEVDAKNPRIVIQITEVGDPK